MVDNEKINDHDELNSVEGVASRSPKETLGSSSVLCRMVTNEIFIVIVQGMIRKEGTAYNNKGQQSLGQAWA